MQRISEPNVNETWKCLRCKETHCMDCVDLHMVDFDIMDEPEGINQQKEQWEGETVCPWCYNQLVDKKTQKPKRDERMNCPTCRSNKIYDHPISGLCCRRCGLIIDTYETQNKPKQKNVKRSAKCLGCKEKKDMTIHHIIPKRNGGKKTIKLCRACHNIADIIANVIYPIKLTRKNERREQ